jgi:hypothetical protein
VVDANSGGLLTVVEENSSPTGWATNPISSSGRIASTAYGYYVEGFLHAHANDIPGGPAGTGPGSGGGTGPAGGGTGPAGGGTEPPGGGTPTGNVGLTGTPATLYDPAGEEAYYRGANGDLTEAAWTGGNLKVLDLGHQMQGTPAVFYDSANGQEEIYYEGANGNLDMSYWKGGNLGFLDLGRQTTSSPAGLYNSGDGLEETWFRGANGNLIEGYWSGGYKYLDLGSAVSQPQ